jgi:hypothetical protein
MRYLARIICCAALLLFAAGICQAANQTGALLEIKGTVSQSSGDSTQTRDVDLLVPDAKIHSGVPRTSPCDNISSDSYVLQGGSPTGCDNESSNSNFETTQSPGTYTFKAAATATQPAYQFDVQTSYQSGEVCSNNFICANPDTGFLRVTNNGPSSFAGTISLSGNAGITGTPGCPSSNTQPLASLTFGGNVESPPLAPGGSTVLALSADSSGCGGFQSDTTSGDIQPVAPGTTTILLPDGPLTQSITLPSGTTMNCSGTPAVAAMRDVLKLVDPLVFNPTVANGNPGNTALFGGSSIPGPPQANPNCLLVTSSKCAIIVNQCFDSAGNQFPDCKCIVPPGSSLIGLDSVYSNTVDAKNPAYVIAQDDAAHQQLLPPPLGPDWTNITKSFLPGCTTPPCGIGGGGKRLNGQESVIDLNLTCQILTFVISPATVSAGGVVNVSGNLQGCPALPGSSSSGLFTFTFEGPMRRGGVCQSSRVSIPAPPPPGGKQRGFPVTLPAPGFNFPFSFNLTVPSNACTGPFKFSTTIKSGTVFYNESVPLTVQ